MHIRRTILTDIPALKSLYVDTILSVNARDYDNEQIKAWASTSENISSLEKRIAEQYFIVAENEEGIITGFASLDDQTGHLDLMYIHKDFQRMGIATLLLNDLMDRANEMNLTEITTDASLTAKPFFEKNGFKVIKQQMVVIKGVEMINFKMKR